MSHCPMSAAGTRAGFRNNHKEQPMMKNRRSNSNSRRLLNISRRKPAAGIWRAGFQGRRCTYELPHLEKILEHQGGGDAAMAK